LHVLGQNEPARAAYERSLKKQPNDPSVLNNHAYYLALQKTQLERALECSSLAIELIPEEANFLDTHAWVLYQMGRYPEALDYITQALFLSEGTEPTFLEHDGDIRMAMGDTNGALNSWKTALMHGGNAEILNQKIREAS
jgi:Flp pilus assembly protein TadD